MLKYGQKVDTFLVDTLFLLNYYYGNNYTYYTRYYRFVNGKLKIND